MGHAAERAKRLIEEDDAFADAIAVVRRKVEDDGEVEWRDVSDDLTSGQWGRLIQEGVLESGEDGFRLADPEGVEEVLGGDHVPIDVEVPEVEAEISWSTYDKLAAAGAVLVMVGYWFDSIRNEIGQTIHLVVGQAEALMPFFAVVILLAMVTGLYSALLQANLMDTEVIQAYQARMQAIQDKREAAKEREDEEALERIQQEQLEAMGGMLEMFKAQFRPMVWIMLLTIPMFLWLRWFVDTQLPETEMAVVLPLLGDVRWDEGFIGPMPTWIVWYIVSSIGFGQLVRKVLNIQTSPSS
ncbi:MAG: DUF106 domain-containing protein [Halobacteriales archaeon]